MQKLNRNLLINNSREKRSSKDFKINLGRVEKSIFQQKLWLILLKLGLLGEVLGLLNISSI